MVVVDFLSIRTILRTNIYCICRDSLGILDVVVVPVCILSALSFLLSTPNPENALVETHQPFGPRWLRVW